MVTNASKALKYFLEIADTDQICDQLLALKTLGRCWDGWLDGWMVDSLKVNAMDVFPFHSFPCNFPKHL